MHVGGVGWWTQGRWITCQKWCIVNVIVILWQDPQKWRSFDAPVFTWEQHGQTDPGAKEYTIHWLLNPRLWSCTNSKQTLSLRMIKQQRLAKISCMLTERAISFHTKPSDPLAAITYRHREKVSMVLTFWTETNKSGLQLGCIFAFELTSCSCSEMSLMMAHQLATATYVVLLYLRFALLGDGQIMAELQRQIIQWR